MEVRFGSGVPVAGRRACKKKGSRAGGDGEADPRKK
jgi:hypothetical protein